jgi:PQQ-like domain
MRRVVRDMTVSSLCAAIVLSALAVCSVRVAAADSATTVLANTPWPMFGHDAKHTFRTSLLGPTTNHMLPRTRTGNIVNSQPAVSSDGIFVYGGGGFATVGVRADGLLLWRTPVGAEAKFSGPALDTNGFLYIGGRDNKLWKKVVETGEPICNRYIASDSDIDASPTISVTFPDRVYVTSDYHLYAIGVSGPNQCKFVWQINNSSGLKLSTFTKSSVSLADSSPGAGDSLGDLVVAAGQVVYRVHDAGSSATIVASTQLDGRTKGTTPVINPTTGNIYIGDLNGRFYGLSADLSTRLFTRQLCNRIVSSAALSPDGQTYYVPCWNGELHAVNALTGDERPGFPFAKPGNSYRAYGYAPSVDGAGVIYAGGNDKFLRAIFPNGTLRWESQFAGQLVGPVIVNGGLAVPGVDGYFYRFCPDPNPNDPPSATHVCGFTINTTSP